MCNYLAASPHQLGALANLAGAALSATAALSRALEGVMVDEAASATSAAAAHQEGLFPANAACAALPVVAASSTADLESVGVLVPPQRRGGSGQWQLLPG